MGPATKSKGKTKRAEKIDPPTESEPESPSPLPTETRFKGTRSGGRLKVEPDNDEPLSHPDVKRGRPRKLAKAQVATQSSNLASSPKGKGVIRKAAALDESEPDAGEASTTSKLSRGNAKRVDATRSPSFAARDSDDAIVVSSGKSDKSSSTDTPATKPSLGLLAIMGANNNILNVKSSQYIWRSSTERPTVISCCLLPSGRDSSSVEEARFWIVGTCGVHYLTKASKFESWRIPVVLDNVTRETLEEFLEGGYWKEKWTGLPNEFRPSIKRSDVSLQLREEARAEMESLLHKEVKLSDVQQVNYTGDAYPFVYDGRNLAVNKPIPDRDYDPNEIYPGTEVAVEVSITAYHMPDENRPHSYAFHLRGVWNLGTTNYSTDQVVSGGPATPSRTRTTTIKSPQRPKTGKFSF
jgi:hypothetical protein